MSANDSRPVKSPSPTEYTTASGCPGYPLLNTIRNESCVILNVPFADPSIGGTIEIFLLFFFYQVECKAQDQAHSPGPSGVPAESRRAPLGSGASTLALPRRAHRWFSQALASPLLLEANLASSLTPTLAAMRPPYQRQVSPSAGHPSTTSTSPTGPRWCPLVASRCRCSTPRSA